jgi:[ribosomal protein S5]-alanine N-acetyltransferase
VVFLSKSPHQLFLALCTFLICITMHIISTERLHLSEFTSQDAIFIMALLNSEGWLEYIGDRHIHSTQAAEQYIERALTKNYREKGYGFYKCSLRENGETIGMCGLIKRDYLPDIDIGFAFLPEFMGQGYAFEAAAATLSFARKQLKATKIAAITIPSNLPSIKLLEKLGLTYEKTIQAPGEEVDLLLMGMDL